jgi:hypothetical protein
MLHDGALQGVANAKEVMVMARSRAANREKYPNVPRLAWTIDELCTAANCSRSFYEKEKRNGRGAHETYFGRAIRVTPDDGAAWIASLRTK